MSDEPLTWRRARSAGGTSAKCRRLVVVGARRCRGSRRRAILVQYVADLDALFARKK
jgi:hypothetical protein